MYVLWKKHTWFNMASPTQTPSSLSASSKLSLTPSTSQNHQEQKKKFNDENNHIKTNRCSDCDCNKSQHRNSQKKSGSEKEREEKSREEKRRRKKKRKKKKKRREERRKRGGEMRRGEKIGEERRNSSEYTNIR